MLNAIGWKPDGTKVVLPGRCSSEVNAAADAAGCSYYKVKIEGTIETFIRLAGQWVVL